MANLRLSVFWHGRRATVLVAEASAATAQAAALEVEVRIVAGRAYEYHRGFGLRGWQNAPQCLF